MTLQQWCACRGTFMLHQIGNVETVPVFEKEPVGTGSEARERSCYIIFNPNIQSRAPPTSRVQTVPVQFTRCPSEYSPGIACQATCQTLSTQHFQLPSALQAESGWSLAECCRSRHCLAGLKLYNRCRQSFPDELIGVR